MNKIFICLLFVLTVLASIACVSAVDVDNATSQSVIDVDNATSQSVVDVDDVDSNLVLDNNVDNVSLVTNSSECGVSDNQDNNSVNSTKPKITPPNLNDLINNITGPKLKITLDIHGPKMSKGGLALLQFKIDQASAGSTVYLDRDYKTNVANNIITVNKNLVIDGQGHTVDFANLKNCYFKSTKGDLTFRNLIIKNANNDDDDYGGAFYLNNKNGKYIFDNCSVSNCWAQKSGGAIYAKTDKVLTVKNCTFENNKINKDDGGAIWAKKDIVIESSVFIGNHADDDGGAVYSDKENIYVSNSFFEDNFAGKKGGAIRSSSRCVEVQDSIFRINHAVLFTERNAGAIYAKKDITSTNCRYELNLVFSMNGYQLKSEKGKVKIKNNNFNPVDDFDNIKNVSLNKQNVSFWVKDSKSLKEIFNFIESKEPAWENIVLTLSPDTNYKADFSNQFGFCLHLNTHLTIKGQPGSMIEGDELKNSFIYIANNAVLTLKDVTLRLFDHCFVNRGALYCNNSFFSEIIRIADSEKLNGGVIVNSGSAFFDHCIFSTLALYPLISSVSYGSVLNANSHSLTIFSECNFNHCLTDFIWASDYSTVIVRQKDKIGENFKDCYFAKTAGFSLVSSELYNGTAVFNCSSVDQLQKALYTVNSYTPNAVRVVINLQPGVYELDSDWLSKKNFMRSMDWRDEYYHHFRDVNPFAVKFKNPGDEIERYALDVGAVPIFIEGHNSTVKLVNGDEMGENHFAFIGYGGKLFVNNITFSNFNSVFHNYGMLNVINCTFSSNYDLDGCGAVVYGVESTVNFIDCIFNRNKAGGINTDIANLVGGILRFNSGCNFTNFFKTSNCIGSMSHDGLVEAPEELKSIFALNDSSTFREYGANESVHCFNITSNNYQSQMDYINNVTGLVILNLSNINGKGLGALPSASKVLVLGNDARLSNGDFGNANKGTSINIAMYWRYSFVNLTFSNYDKLMDNHGLCVFINCTFVNNACGDYLVSNNGSCSFINCKFINNKAKNLIFNDAGSIVFDNCSFVNNSYSDKGLIFNKGAIHMENSSILNSGKITIYNFETKDCNVINTTGCSLKYEETKIKHSKWHDFWHYTLLVVACVGAAVAAYFTAGAILPGLAAAWGYGLAYAATITFCALEGAAIGAAVGFGLDYAVLGSIYGYPDAGSLALQYVGLGALCGAVGASIMVVRAHIAAASYASASFDSKNGVNFVYKVIYYGNYALSDLWEGIIYLR